ncbi:hypothetical protein D3C72_1838230 [compost metagenome]
MQATGNPDYMAKKFDISKRFLHLIIDYLKKEFDAPIAYASLKLVDTLECMKGIGQGFCLVIETSKRKLIKIDRGMENIDFLILQVESNNFFMKLYSQIFE